jgi:pilus assembly protein CpaF
LAHWAADDFYARSMTSISPTRFVARPTRGSARSRPPAGHPPTRSSGETLAPAARAERVGSADFGPLAAYLRDQAITDLFINGPNDLWFDRGEGLARDATWSCPGEAELRQLAVRLIALGGRHIDEANPCVDVRLHDGVRLHAVLPPAAPHGTLLSIRIPPVSRLRLVDLEARGFFGGAVSLELVRAEVRARSNILITGAGGSGNTTWNL